MTPAAGSATTVGRVGVLGLGLIGGSLLRWLAAARFPSYGYDIDPATRAAARAAGLQIADSLLRGVQRGDLLVLAVPLTSLSALVSELDAVAPREVLVTDVGSVKAPVAALVTGTRLAYVGGHPMVGTEHSGFAASDPALFERARWVLCLDEQTSLERWLLLAGLYTRLGWTVVPATAAEHDRAVARVSHLPHLVAAALAAGTGDDRLARTLAAGSFRDGTRVAATRPELVAAMCLGNAAALHQEVAALTGQLDEVGALLAADVGGASEARLTTWLARGHEVRTAWPPAPGGRSVLPQDLALRERLLDLGRAGGWVTAVGADGATARLPG